MEVWEVWEEELQEGLEERAWAEWIPKSCFRKSLAEGSAALPLAAHLLEQGEEEERVPLVHHSEGARRSAAWEEAAPSAAAAWEQDEVDHREGLPWTPTRMMEDTRSRHRSVSTAAALTSPSWD